MFLNGNTGMALPFSEYASKIQNTLLPTYYRPIGVGQVLRDVEGSITCFFADHRLLNISEFLGKFQFTCNLHVNSSKAKSGVYSYLHVNYM